MTDLLTTSSITNVAIAPSITELTMASSAIDPGVEDTGMFIIIR